MYSSFILVTALRKPRVIPKLQWVLLWQFTDWFHIQISIPPRPHILSIPPWNCCTAPLPLETVKVPPPHNPRYIAYSTVHRRRAAAATCECECERHSKLPEVRPCHVHGLHVYDTARSCPSTVHISSTFGDVSSSLWCQLRYLLWPQESIICNLFSRTGFLASTELNCI